jgi:hypothetical protein
VSLTELIELRDPAAYTRRDQKQNSDYQIYELNTCTKGARNEWEVHSPEQMYEYFYKPMDVSRRARMISEPGTSFAVLNRSC